MFLRHPNTSVGVVEGLEVVGRGKLRNKSHPGRPRRDLLRYVHLLASSNPSTTSTEVLVCLWIKFELLTIPGK